ncbi:MAG: SAM-dependent chlorinase/fluorinase [Spirochaetes bacterium]|nr:SAM-dependent chlorinase/fluorinase [Spirochaetota bacterium]
MCIALITDFGLNDPYVGVVKGVIYSQGFKGKIVDVCHSVVPYSIEHAQFILATSYTYFPKNTVFLVVVDPGVGTQRKILLVYDGTYYFLMPDNGIVGCLKKNALQVWVINTEEFTNVSTTFHGRDIFAVVAAQLAMHGLKAVNCSVYSNYVVHPFPFFTVEKGIIATKVAHVDRFGNCILSLPNDTYSLQLHTIVVKAKHYQLHHCITYAQLDPDMIGILQGSSGFVEVCMNQNNCSKQLNVTIGDMVELHYE